MSDTTKLDKAFWGWWRQLLDQKQDLVWEAFQAGWYAGQTEEEPSFEVIADRIRKDRQERAERHARERQEEQEATNE